MPDESPEDGEDRSTESHGPAEGIVTKSMTRTGLSAYVRETFGN